LKPVFPPEQTEFESGFDGGGYDVAAETNWRSETVERSLTFD
jgi:hypothetical protein